MQDERDDYEPIIATRRRRELREEDTQPLWKIVLALVGCLVAVALLGWWLMGRLSNEDSSATQADGAATDFGPEIEVEQEVAPQARDAEPGVGVVPTPQPPAAPPVAPEPAVPESAAVPEPEQSPAPTEEPDAGIEQAATSDIPPVVPEVETEAPAPPARVSVRLASPDSQVRIELRRLADTSSTVSGKVGDVVDVEPGTYRAIVSGAGLETLEQEVTFDGDRPLEYTVELCAERKYERESVAGRVVEERACASTAECQSMFLVLSEYAEQLVKDRAFRTQQCEKWRDGAAPEGPWTLDTKCEGTTTICRIEIAQGVCALAGPRRSARGTACPRSELGGA